MLLQRPVISGRYSASPFVNMLSGPLDEALRPLFATLVHMGELVQSILSEEPRSDRAQVSQLEAVIQDVEAHRCYHIGDSCMMSTLGMRASTSKADWCCLCAVWSVIQQLWIPRGYGWLCNGMSYTRWFLVI